MAIKLENLSGNGSVLPNSIFTYSYSEDVTSLEPSNIAGATSQVNISAIAVDSEIDNLQSDTKLLINNNMIFTDDDRGSVTFQVKNVSINAASASITGDTIQTRLNVEKTADPHGGSGATLLTAIIEYCGLVDIIPIIDEAFATELDLVPVNFIGWKGNVWEKLKELCAGFSVSTTDNVGLEMVIKENDLIFRKAKQNQIIIDSRLSDKSLNIESFETAKSVKVFSYNTNYGIDQVYYQTSNFDQSKKEEDRFQSSITDQMQVEAGETLRKRFTVNCTFEAVNQPVCVDQITRTPPAPYAGATGEYVIVGVDDLPIDPLQWTENGGSLVVELVDENGEALQPGEIELVITAPKFTNLPQSADPNEAVFAPYKIGVESSGEAEYPALWLTGTGVFYNKKEKLFLTGSSNEYTSKAEGPTIDNIFIIDDHNLSSRGVAAAQANCGPKITLNQSIPDGFLFSDNIGSVQSIGLNNYRINSANFSQSSVDLVSTSCFTINEWNAIWSTQDFNSFNTITDGLKFNEFSIVPKVSA